MQRRLLDHLFCCGRVLGALSLFLLSCSAPAIDRVQLELGSVDGGSWRIDDISLDLGWSADGQSTATLKAARLAMGAHRIDTLELSCAAFDLLQDKVDCRNGRLSLRSDVLDVVSVPAAFTYHLTTQQLTVSVTKLPLAGGLARLVLNQQDGAWHLNLAVNDVSLDGIVSLVGKAGVAPPPLAVQGRCSGSLELHGSGQGLRSVAWKIETQDSGYSNAEGSQAAEALQIASSGSARQRNGDWQADVSLLVKQGMLYADPVYLEFSQARPLDLAARLQWRSRAGELQLQELNFRQPEVVSGKLAALLVPAAEQPLRDLQMDIEQARLPGLYSTWIQPWMAGTALEKLETSGALRGQLSLQAGLPQALSLQLDQVSFHKQDGQFGVRGLDGVLQWDRSDTVHTSELAWQGANFYQLQVGAAALQLETGSSSLKMQQALVVPLLDGQLHVDEFELGMDNGQVRWLLDGMLTPVSMKAFSSALGWPPLAGKLSGMVPGVRYEKGELTLGGVLLVQAFDGDITVRDLRIDQPLGLVPRLWASARLEHLDLDTLTRAFSFGRIEGRLQGEVKDLYMEAWQLVAFDAHFETPPDDDSRHRISQKAVDNISNLGGAGVGGAVSRGFLRFLEDFPYKRLGIRCRLENGICHMDGVAPAASGYYLVQGTVLPPRLDVIGFAPEVDWPSLLERLASVTRGETPVIQ